MSSYNGDCYNSKVRMIIYLVDNSKENELNCNASFILKSIEKLKIWLYRIFGKNTMRWNEPLTNFLEELAANILIYLLTWLRINYGCKLSF